LIYYCFDTRKKTPAAATATMTAHGRDKEDDIFGRDKPAKNNNQQTKGIVSGVCGLGRGGEKNGNGGR
jgi:hypothetical protein